MTTCLGTSEQKVQEPSIWPQRVRFIKLTLAPTIKNYDPKQKFYSIAHNFAIPAS